MLHCSVVRDPACSLFPVQRHFKLSWFTLMIMFLGNSACQTRDSQEHARNSDLTARGSMFIFIGNRHCVHQSREPVGASCQAILSNVYALAWLSLSGLVKVSLHLAVGNTRLVGGDSLSCNSHDHKHACCSVMLSE